MSTRSKEWKVVRGSWISAELILPGVGQRKESGHVARGRATDPRTGKQRDVWRVLIAGSKHEAYQRLQEELGRIRSASLRPSVALSRIGRVGDRFRDHGEL
jgi:hypothetical protein